MAFVALNNRAAPTIPVPGQATAPAPLAAPHPQEIDVAFASNSELRKRVHAAIGAPTADNIYKIYAYVYKRPESHAKHPLPRHLDLYPQSSFTTHRRTSSKEAQARRE